MALQVDSAKAYERTVTDHEDGAKYKVWFRKLTHGEMEERRQRAIKMRANSRKKGRKAAREQLQYDGAAMNNYTYLRAIVRWEFPFEKNAEEFAKLDEDIFSQLQDHLYDIMPRLDPENEFEDEDEDEIPEPETDDEGNVIPLEQEYDEETGPTERAFGS